MKRTISSGTAFLVAGLCFLSGIRSGGADLGDSYSWKRMKIGGGGWVVGMDVSPTEKGLMYVRTDVSGAYRWDPATSAWKQIVTSSSMPPDWVNYGKYSGVDSIVGAPKDPNIAYMAFCGSPWNPADGQIFKSTNRGDTWTATHFLASKVKMLPNGEGRQEGDRLAVDPNNSDVVYFASIQDGLWLTGNGGADWTKASAIPAGTPPHGVNSVVFDKAGGTTSSGGGADKTNVIYVTVYGGGVYRSPDAGATWTRISDANPGPGMGKPHDATLGPDRTYYVAYTNDNGGAGSVWKYSPEGVWTNITPPPPNGGNQSYWEFAADPSNPRHIVAMINGGKCFVSTDQGATWTYHLFHLNSPNIQWMGKQENYFLSSGQLAFDPFQPGRLWYAEGFGVWWADDLTTDQIEWHAASEGIEEACANDVIAPPGGRPVGAMWDLGTFYFSDPDLYTAIRSQPNFMAAWALDWCAADPKFIAGVFRNNLGFPPHPNSSGYSTDGGQTWTRFPAVDKGTSPPELEYGTIAVSANSPDKIVWSPAKGKLPCYTTDRGATWKQSSFGGPTDTGFVDFPMTQKPLCADRVLPDTFYFYRPQDGVYRSTDDGANFAKVGCPVAQKWLSILKSTPGHAGDLWFAEGTGAGGLWHSTDGGATWKQIPWLTQASAVGLGKAQTEGGYPTVYAAGTVNGQNGVYRSTDTGATWDKICDYPVGIFANIVAIDGDKDVFGTVYVSFTGAGFAYGALKNNTAASP